MESTIFHGPKISIFPSIVVHAGPREQPVPLPTESTSQGTELGLTFPFLLRSSLTAKQEAAATEETLEASINMLKIMEFLRKAVRTIWPKIPITSAVPISRSVRTALTPKDRSQETLEIAGLLLGTLFGK